MKDQFSVFIIGPMGKEKAEESHTLRLKESATKALISLGYTQDEFSVKIPDDLRGNYIPEDVFHEMDIADFAIADISFRSPNVFYEIAFFNSLGTPIIIFDQKQKENQDIPFYWNQARIEFVDEFSVDILKNKIESILSDFFNDEVGMNLSSNPITRFYNFPTIDISAATGLAVGYFDNFLKNIIAEPQGVLDVSKEVINNMSETIEEYRKLDEIIIIRPKSLDSFRYDRDSINDGFSGLRSATYKAPLSRRGSVYLSHVSNGSIIDLPTPIYTMSSSPRYKKMRRRLYNYPNYNRDTAEAILNKLSDRMIDAFFSTLKYLIRDDNRMGNRWMVVNSVDLN